MWQEIKAHKGLAIGAVVGVLVIYYLFSGSSSHTVNSAGVDPSSVAAAAAIQQAQLQAAQHGQDTAAAIQANHDNIGGQIALETLKTNSSNFIANLEATLGSQKINAQEQDTALISTLTAQTQQAGITAATQQKQIDSTTSITNTESLANALVAESNNQASVAMASINKPAPKQCSFFSGLFGGC